MNGSGKSFYRYGEPSVGEAIAIDQIKKGDKINAVAKRDSQLVRLTQYYAGYDGDSRSMFADAYNFILVYRPEPKPNYPTTIGAIIKFPHYVPVILTKDGWVFTGRLSRGKDSTYFTPNALAVCVGDELSADFEVLYAG